jgi:alpha-L-fucosidase 2
LYAGKPREAENLAMTHAMSSPLRQESYQPFGDLIVTFPGHVAAQAYRRSLDLDRAVATVRYRIKDTTYTRELFSSFPDDVLVLRLSADQPAQISFTATLTSAHTETALERSSERTLALTGRVTHRSSTETPSQMTFASQLRVHAVGGKVTLTDTTASVTDADEVVLLLVTGTSYKSYRDISADPVRHCEAHLKALEGVSYGDLFKRHLEDHQSLFRRVTLDLGDLGSAAKQGRPTDRRIAAFADDHDPQLAALAFQHGRYLLIASSRPGSQAPIFRASGTINWLPPGIASTRPISTLK